MRPARLAVVALVSVLGLAGLQHAASADPTNCFVSSTTVAQGGSFIVSGPNDINNEFIRAVLDSATQIGSGFATATGTPIQFSFTAVIPPSTSANAIHTLQVVGEDGAFACSSILVVPAAAPTPSPSPSPGPSSSPPPPTTTPPTTTFPVFIPITISQQQQQQQQQQGGGGGGNGQQQGHGSSGGGQQQQQQQQQDPTIRDVAASILPRTGTDATRIGAWGAGLLLVGLLLVRWSRRRRRRAQRAYDLAALPPIDAVIVEPEGSWVPGMPHPSEFLAELDGVPPLYIEWPEQRYLPAPEEPNDDEDVLTPSF